MHRAKKIVCSNPYSKAFIKYALLFNASIAQLVEQLICNQQVMGSSPFTSLIHFTYINYTKFKPIFCTVGILARSKYAKPAPPTAPTKKPAVN